MIEQYDKDSLTESLNIFLSDHAQSSLDTRMSIDSEGNEEEILAVIDPWGDPTLIIEIPHEIDDRTALIDSLNSISLPRRYSAIIHKDIKTLEVIWTAYKRTSIAAEVEGRSFDFIINGSVYACKFDRSSDRLMSLAKHCTPISSAGPSEHRNILSLHLLANGMDYPYFGEPVSFFVEIHDLDDNGQLELVRNLNAYMIYYDRQTPRILTHEEVESASNYQRPRYLSGAFPQKIMARPLDQNALSFWVEASSTVNPIMRFLLCYRILEYTAFNFVEAETRLKIRKIIAAPNIHDRIDNVASDVAELVGIFKETHEIARMTNLVSATMDFERVWKYIESQKAFFSSEISFDGGFCVKAAITEKETFENWKKNAVNVTLKALRDIRNALSHGQDGASRGTVQPSRANQELLRPWGNVIEMLAGDAMLYRDVV